MPHPLEYAVKDALMMCDKGATPGQFTPNTNTNITISGALVATEFDKAPLVHVPCFGACAAKGGSACTPAPIKWMDTYSVRVKQGETLLFKSSLPCSVGGKIEFLTSGQVPLPPGELEALMEEFGEEEEEEGGWGWWDTAELIPVVGNVIGMVREAKKGNWGMFALNAVFSGGGRRYARCGLGGDYAPKRRHQNWRQDYRENGCENRGEAGSQGVGGRGGKGICEGGGEKRG